MSRHSMNIVLLLAIRHDKDEQTTAIGVFGWFGSSLKAANGGIAQHVGNLPHSSWITKSSTNKVLVTGGIS